MNDHSYANAVRETLKSCINSLGCMKTLYLSNPEKDFTRTRKISFEDFINICLQMGNGSLQNELMKFYDFEGSAIPCKSAFCQQRSKVSSEAMHILFCAFTELLMGLDRPKTFRGYRLLACDGSDINIPYNPLDVESFHYVEGKRATTNCI